MIATEMNQKGGLTDTISCMAMEIPWRQTNHGIGE